MKRRINEHRGLASSAIEIAGHDIKLGQGGIREIEFAAQTLQLVWGGRDPRLRDPTTLGALRRLARAGLLDRRATAELTVAYRVLRKVEHRLQMVADRQTHTLPTKPAELAQFALFMGCAGPDAFRDFLMLHLDRVRRRYAEVFEQVPETPGPAGGLDLTGMDSPPSTVATLQSLGFRNVTGMIATLRGWRTGRIRALRSERSRDLMDQVLPALLAALGAQSDPDTAFARFDAMLARQPAGVQLLSMFQRNPALLERVAAVLGAAPSLADHLATVPAALEGLLAPAEADSTRRARSPPGCRTRARSRTWSPSPAPWCAPRSSACASGRWRAGSTWTRPARRTALADATLAALLPSVLEEHAARYGTVRGGAMAVVALGKAGGREMMAGRTST